jgi:REP element-mobilizing transposase RayT
MRPLAYHITWGTYGTRLRYGPRPTVSRKQAQLRTPVLVFEPHLWEREKENLKYLPVLLTSEQMKFIESIVPALCDRGRWTHRASAAGPDHVHVVLTSDHDPDIMRRLLKRWLGQELSRSFLRPIDESQLWWAECGSIKWIGDDAYLATAIKYVNRQRAVQAVGHHLILKGKFS